MSVKKRLTRKDYDVFVKELGVNIPRKLGIPTLDIENSTSEARSIRLRIYKAIRKNVGGTVTRGDLAGKVAAKLGGPRSQGDAALNAVLDSVRESLAAGDRVVLTGFGAFESRQVKERQVRAIRGLQAGQRITVPAHKRVGFTPGSDLAAAVRGRR